MAASVGRWMAPGRWFGPVGQGIASGATRDHHPRVAGGHPRVAGGHQLPGGWLGRLVVVIGLKTSPKGGTARAEVTSARRNGTPGWRACGTAQNGRDIGLACMRDRSERPGVAGRRACGTAQNGPGCGPASTRDSSERTGLAEHALAGGAARTSGSAHRPLGADADWSWGAAAGNRPGSMRSRRSERTGGHRPAWRAEGGGVMAPGGMAAWRVRT